jgi:hypothetical protein
MLPFLFAAALALPSDFTLGSRQHAVVKAQSFDAAALTWSGDADLMIRISDDGVRWSEWMTPAIDDDVIEHHATAITHFAGTNRYLEYTFSASVDRVSVTLFPPAPPPRVIHEESFVLGSIPVRSREDWGCPDGEASTLWTPMYTVVTHAVVHHTAGANNLTNWEAEVRNIWYFHTYSNGWGDIGYNYLIDPNGVVYEGRAGGDHAIGAHFSCRNSNTVGVALLGTFSTVPPTDAALASLKNLLTELCRRNEIDPMATVHHPSSGLNLPTILGHRDGNVPGATCTITECPGDVVYSMLPAIRSDLEMELSVPLPPRRRAVRP